MLLGILNICNKNELEEEGAEGAEDCKSFFLM
jgi:hypothetical protein